MTESTLELKKQRCLSNRYVIQRTLGVGGFGITYAAYDTQDKRDCAVKELFPQGVVTRMTDGTTVVTVSSEKDGSFEHSKERFLEEAEILQDLNPVHEVVSVYDFFMENGTCYFVMEYLDGMTLRKLIKGAGGKLPFEIVMDIVQKIGKALIVVHNHKIFHRDISPDNIIVTTRGEVKLIDFGNAKSLSQNANQGLSVVLKPGFAPLEQYSMHGKQGTYTDVYSFACTIYYMLTGEKIPDALERTRGAGYKRLKEYGFPAYVSDAIDQALEIRVVDRIQRVDTFLKKMRLDDDFGNEFADSTSWLTVSVREIPHKPKKTRYIQILQLGRPDIYKELIPNKSMLIGRNEEICDIVVPGDPHISKRHCEIIYDERGKRFFVMDHSSNGLYVNGKRLPAEQPVLIKPGQLVMLGSDKSGFKVGEKL